VRSAYSSGTTRPTMSAVKPRFRRGASVAWRRFRDSLRSSTTRPDGLDAGLSPVSVWMGTRSPRRFLYVTKLTVHRRLVALLKPDDPLLLYGCGGLPSVEVCRHARATWRHFRAPAYFLGDLDPADVGVFLALWRGAPDLSSGHAGIPVRHLGIGSALIALFRPGLTSAQLKSSCMDMTSAEMAHVRLLDDIAGGLEAIVGAEPTSLLERGKKIELEGLLRWAGPGTRLCKDLRSFLLSGRG